MGRSLKKCVFFKEVNLGRIGKFQQKASRAVSLSGFSCLNTFGFRNRILKSISKFLLHLPFSWKWKIYLNWGIGCFVWIHEFVECLWSYFGCYCRNMTPQIAVPAIFVFSEKRPDLSIANHWTTRNKLTKLGRCDRETIELANNSNDSIVRTAGRTSK